MKKWYNDFCDKNICACSSGDRAFDSDSKGRAFESRQARELKQNVQIFF